MAKELKRGFRFVGPTTAYAMMQACGLVDDHIQGMSGSVRPRTARRPGGSAVREHDLHGGRARGDGRSATLGGEADLERFSSCARSPTRC